MCIMIGEDIEFMTPWTPKPYGGAFKVTKDLSELFKGRGRIFPTTKQRSWEWALVWH